MKISWIPFQKALEDKTGGQPKVFKKTYLSEGKLPVIDQGQENIAGYTDDLNMRYKGPLPVILFGDHTRIFKCINYHFALGADGVKVLTPREPFEAKFLYYYFLSIEIPSRGYSRHFKYLKDVLIPFFPPSEQHRIVEILDQADALRTQRAEADAKAERILPALFYKMFGDPATNPMGWEISTLSDTRAQIRYGLGQPPMNSSTGMPLIRATNIRHGKISDSDMLYVDSETVPKSRNAFLSAEEVIVVRSGAYTGDVAQVTEKWQGAVIGYDLVITPGEKFFGEFLESYLLSSHIQKNYFGNLKARAGQPHLNASQLGSTPVFCPPNKIQSRFADHVRNIRKMREQSLFAKKILNNLFSNLSHHAFSGDLTAKWCEAHTKELLAEMEEQAKMLNMMDTNS